MEQTTVIAAPTAPATPKEAHKPRLYFIKIEHKHTHQGCVKLAQRIITTHDTRIMPKYFKDRGWTFASASRKPA